MNLRCPDGKKIVLDENLSLDEKKDVANELLKKYYQYVCCSWGTESVNYFLNGLANYLIYHREVGDYSHDKDVLSKRKMSKLKKYDKNNVLMTELSLEERVNLGLTNLKDEY